MKQYFLTMLAALSGMFLALSLYPHLQKAISAPNFTSTFLLPNSK